MTKVWMLATGVPEGAQAQDLEVAFGVMATGLPEAVATLMARLRALMGQDR